MLQVGSCRYKSAPRLGHLLPIYGQEPVREYGGGQPVFRAFENSGPKQGMEIDNVLADKVVQLGLTARFEILLKIQVSPTVAEVLEAGQVTNRGIQPDIEILVFGIRNLKPRAKVFLIGSRFQTGLEI